MSLADTIIILIGALVLFGPKKLPELARQLGKIMGELRRASNEFKFQMEEELRATDLANLTKADSATTASSTNVNANSQGQSKLVGLISPSIQPPATGEPVVNRVSIRAQQNAAPVEDSATETVADKAAEHVDPTTMESEAVPHA